MIRMKTAGMIVAVLASSGCSSTNPFSRDKLMVPVGPSYVAGRGLQMFPTSENLVANVKAAMADLGVRAIHQVPEPNGAIALEATSADNRSVRVTIEAGAVRSLVAAKFGWFGDEPLTRALLDRIAARQGTLPPALSPVDVPTEPAKTEPESGTNPFFSRKAVPDSVMLRDRLDAGFGPSITPAPGP